jgi:hypothetical protein
VTGFKQDAHIDLNEGAFSNAGGAEMLISIAYGVTVENAVTGNGNDIIAGNGVANLLQGSEGSDRLFGGAGDDILHGDGGIARDTESTFTLTQLATSVSNQKLLASNVQLLGSDGSFTFEFLWDFAQTDNELYNISFGGADFFRFPAGNMGLNFWNASEATWDPDVTRLGIADGELHRISVTYDNISGEMVVYVDGEQVHSRVLPPDTAAFPLSAISASATTPPSATCACSIMPAARRKSTIMPSQNWPTRPASTGCCTTGAAMARAASFTMPAAQTLWQAAHLLCSPARPSPSTMTTCCSAKTATIPLTAVPATTFWMAARARTSSAVAQDPTGPAMSAPRPV